jgi:hypothetical protein
LSWRAHQPSAPRVSRRIVIPILLANPTINDNGNSFASSEIDAILDYLVVGLLKRLNDCHPAEDVVEINSHVDGILKRLHPSTPWLMES